MLIRRVKHADTECIHRHTHAHKLQVTRYVNSNSNSNSSICNAPPTIGRVSK